MEDQQSDDWLPDGWMVEIRERRNGKKDKCYCAPSGDRIFFSKAEVFRYLNMNGVKCEDKEKDHGKQFGNNVIVEKIEAQGLPPGWTKEIKITKKANKVRKDPYYIDPVNGFVFRSMKDALRYIETGDIGRLAFKPKDKCSNDEDLGDDIICSPLLKTDEELPDGIVDKMDVSNVSQTGTAEQLLTTAARGEQITPPGHDSDQCKAGVSAVMSGSNLQEEKKSEQKGDNSGESAHSSTVPVEVLQNKQSPGGTAEYDNKRTAPTQRKSKVRKMPDLPRRASKRLAGLAVEPTPELKESNRARRATVGQSCDAVASAVETSSPGICILQAPKLPDETESTIGPGSTFTVYESKDLSSGLENSRLSSGDMPSPSNHSQKIESENKDDELHVSSAKKAAPEVLSGEVGSNNKAVEMPELPLDVPLADLWTDPCIAFAIKTLTGMPYDTPKVSSESNSCKSLEAVSTTEEHSGGEQGASGSYERQGCAVVLPLTQPALPKEHAPKIEGSNKTDKKPGSPDNTPFADILADPCIEFAIKTLTGVIPVGFGLENQECTQQQLSYMQTPTDSHSTLPNDNFGQNCLWSQQYDVTSCTGNPSFRSQGGTGRHQYNDQRMNAKGRPSAFMYSSGSFVDMNGRF